MENIPSEILALSSFMAQGRRTVFFGGAGTSTESSIPDFRSKDGLYSTRFRHREPEYLLSIDCLLREPELFFEYLRTKLYCPNTLPNGAHYALARMEARGLLDAVITQNIDGLHQAAGSRRVLELHGSMARAACMACGAPYAGEALFEEPPIPRCRHCSGMLRPLVTLYGETLDDETVEAAITALSRAEILIVGGTSLVVQPAASFLSHFSGDTLILMNREATPLDRRASLIIRDPIGLSLARSYELAFGVSPELG